MADAVHALPIRDGKAAPQPLTIWNRLHACHHWSCPVVIRHATRPDMQPDPTCNPTRHATRPDMQLDPTCNSTRHATLPPTPAPRATAFPVGAGYALTACLANRAVAVLAARLRTESWPKTRCSGLPRSLNRYVPGGYMSGRVGAR
jgi:hypothetical protein